MSLANAPILVVEDEYLIAVSLQAQLEDAGAIVLGPVPSVKAALQIIETAPLDAAILNVNLVDGLSIAVADALRDRGKPFVFVTAYQQNFLPGTHISVPVLNKPVDPAQLVDTLAARLTIP